MSKYPWINDEGIDFVEVNNVVNPPNVANKGKVVGIDEEGRCALIDGGSGGGELPEVTDADDGKILIVEGGEWVSDYPGGSSVGSIFIEISSGTVERIVMDSTEITLDEMFGIGWGNAKSVSASVDGNIVIGGTPIFTGDPFSGNAVGFCTLEITKDSGGTLDALVFNVNNFQISRNGDAQHWHLNKSLS